MLKGNISHWSRRTDLRTEKYLLALSILRMTWMRSPVGLRSPRGVILQTGCILEPPEKPGPITDL